MLSSYLLSPSLHDSQKTFTLSPPDTTRYHPEYTLFSTIIHPFLKKSRLLIGGVT
jgi:hypothetical protein